LKKRLLLVLDLEHAIAFGDTVGEQVRAVQ
jgi:hypothetical protein